MSDTPRCDQHVSNWRNLAPGEVSTMEFTRQLERELNAAKEENAAMREVIKNAYEVIRLSAYPDHAALARLKCHLK